jgi:hypothetical protein
MFALQHVNSCSSLLPAARGAISCRGEVTGIESDGCGQPNW